MKKYLCFPWLKTVLNDSMKKIKVLKVLPALIFIMTFSGLAGQQPERLKDALIVLDEEEGSNLGSLVKDVYPTIILQNGNHVIAGKETPSQDILKAYCSASSVNMLYQDNPQFEKVELIKLTINSSEETWVDIDLSQLNNFPLLKYVYLRFTYDACNGLSDSCLENIVREMVTGTNNRIKVVYELSILE
jgi:hypothetical protein